jgi:hypothetical protein
MLSSVFFTEEGAVMIFVLELINFKNKKTIFNLDFYAIAH